MNPIDIIGGSYPDKTPDISPADTINWEPEVVESAGRAQKVFRMPWGLKSFAATASGTGRGFILWDGVVYAVVGSALFSITSAGVATNLGAITGSGPVQMAFNSVELVIVTGSTGYTYDTSNGLRAITDAQFPSAKTVTSLNQRVIVDGGGSNGFWHISALVDGRTWTDPDPDTAEARVGSAEYRADKVVAVLADHSQVLVFGETTMEPWFNTGAGSFPFERQSDLILETGCVAPYSIQRVDNAPHWIDDKGIVRAFRDGTAVRISNLAVEQDIADTGFAAATSSQFQRVGHWFYVLHLPGGKTWVYDARQAARVGTEQAWFRRQSHNRTGWRAAYMVYAWNKWLALDTTDGTVWEMTDTVFDEGGELIVRERITPPFHRNGAFFQVPEVRLEVTTGTAPISISDAEIELGLSRDRGRSFPNYKTRSLGDTGEYIHKVTFRRLGRFREVVASIRTSAKVKTDLMAGEAILG